MNYFELSHVLADKEISRIGMKTTTAGGSEHPFWTILNTKFPPAMPWLRLNPAVRGMVKRAADLLHFNNIPYTFYTNFLVKFKKGYLKHKPMTLLAYKIRKDGGYQLLPEYIYLFNKAKECFLENGEIIKINDALYEMFPKAYECGTLSFIHSITLIQSALKNHALKDIYAFLGNASSVQDFWNALGTSVVDNKNAELDLTEGYSSADTLNLLKDEMSIRMGKVEGKPNQAFNRCFKKNGTLSTFGIAVLSGEKELK